MSDDFDLDFCWSSQGKRPAGKMAKYLEDGDKRIANLARMYSTELSTKDNAVYNHFVDMFSLLTKERESKEEAVRNVLKFLAEFIEKVVETFCSAFLSPTCWLMSGFCSYLFYPRQYFLFHDTYQDGEKAKAELDQYEEKA